MKAFVSGQIKEKKSVREVYARLAEMGISITHDWTTTDDLHGASKQSKEAGARAYRDIRGVCDAELYILMSNNKICGKGMYVELGAALAHSALTGWPKIYVAGPMNHASIFYYHPRVSHFPSIDSCLDHIRQEFSEVSSKRGGKKFGRKAA